METKNEGASTESTHAKQARRAQVLCMCGAGSTVEAQCRAANDSTSIAAERRQRKSRRGRVKMRRRQAQEGTGRGATQGGAIAHLSTGAQEHRSTGSTVESTVKSTTKSTHGKHAHDGGHEYYWHTE